MQDDNAVRAIVERSHQAESIRDRRADSDARDQGPQAYRMAHGWRIATLAPCVAYALLLIVLVVLTLQHEAYDDSYFFKRIAVNALDHGVLAWNVDEGPVYGATSQLFQLVMVGLAALTRDYTMLATRVFLSTCLMLSFGLAFVATRRKDSGVAATFAACSPAMLFTAVSGMETALAFLLITGLLVVLYREPTGAERWGAVPVLTLAIWLTRPDALLLVAPLLLERWHASRRRPWRELLVIGLGIGSSLIVFKLYYGTALPLPFYAKQHLTSPYDASFIELSNAAQRTRFSYFATIAGPLFATGMLRRDRVNLALLGASLAFVSYHLLTTIDVMGMHGRFFAPALPVLVLASARAAETAASRRVLIGLALLCGMVAALLAEQRVLPNLTDRLEGVPVAFYVAGGVGALCVFAGPLAPMLARWTPLVLPAAAILATAQSYGPTVSGIASDARLLRNHARHVTVYRGMDVLRSCFGEAIHVYHSEVGVPGLRFQRGKVSDLAGLLSRRWLFRKESFDEMCSADQPEAIFLPHKNYRSLNREILRGSCIRGYVREVQDSSSPLYVRHDLHAHYQVCSRK
jgi:hypothetical protein